MDISMYKEENDRWYLVKNYSFLSDTKPEQEIDKESVEKQFVYNRVFFTHNTMIDKNMPEIYCYAERSDDIWEAFCTTFDLAVQGHTMSEVCSDLEKAIYMYLDYIKTLPVEEQEDLLNRRSPDFDDTKAHISGV